MKQTQPEILDEVEYVDSHLPQRGESRIHASCKSAGSQGQPKRQDLVLICHPFECESQESSAMGGYLDVKVCVFQIQRHEPVPWAYLREDLFQSEPERAFHQGVIQKSEI